MSLVKIASIPNQVSNLGLICSNGAEENNHEKCKCATVTMLEQQRKELEEHFQRELKLQMEHLEMVEKKCDTILGRTPVLAFGAQSEEITSLRKELETERQKRKENEQNFMECVDKLMEEILEVAVKVLGFGEKIQEMEKIKSDTSMPPPGPKQTSSSSSSSYLTSNEVTEMISTLTSDIQSKLQELKENQKHFVKKNLNMRNMNCSFTIVSAQPAFKTPLFNQVDSVDNTVGNFGSEASPGSMSTKEIDLSGTLEFKNSIDYGVHAELFTSDITKAHGKAPRKGNYLPFPCLCGLEFETEGGLAGHTEMIPDTARRTSAETMDTLMLIPSSFCNSSLSTRTGRKRKGKLQGKNPSGSVLSASQPASIPDKQKHGIETRNGKPDGSPMLFCKCGKGFAKNKSRNRHVREHNSGKRFKCKMCFLEFYRPYNLQRHMKYQHKK